MSPAVWLVIGVRVLVEVTSYTIMPAATSSAVDSRPVSLVAVFIVLFIFMYLYLFSGTFRSMVLGQGTVSVQESIHRGKEVFNQFLWLWIKIFLVVLFALVLLLSFFVNGSTDEMEVQTRLKEIAPRLNLFRGIFMIIAPFILVYWLPIVFATSDFRVLPTMKSALAILWRRLPKSGYLAFLIFFPVVVVWLLPEGSPLIVLLGISVLRDLMLWTAFIYCAESVTEHRHIVVRGTSA